MTATGGKAQIRVLGVPDVVVDGTPRPVPPNVRRLLVELAFAGPTGLSIDELCEIGPGRSRAAVQTVIWRVRKIIGSDGVVTERDRYRLGDQIEVDVDRFEREVRDGWDAAVRDDAAEAADLLGAALARWRGMPDEVEATDEGVQRRRVVISERAAAIERWAQVVLRHGDADGTGEIVETLRALVSEQPLREGAWATLIEAHHAAGEPARAAAVTAEAIAVLAAAGMDPSHERLTAAVQRSTGQPKRPRRSRNAAVPAWLEAVRDGRSFVGREAELDALVGGIERGLGGRTAMIVVAGEAGAGKSRLLAEAARLAAPRGLVVWGGRWDRHQSTPFQGIVEAIDQVLDSVAVGAIDRSLSDRLRPFQDSLDPADPEATPARDDLPTLCEAVVDLFTAATRDRPALLVLDDLHWASWSSLLILRHLVRSCPTLPLCVLVGLRTSDPIAPSMRDLLDELIREHAVDWVELAGLTPVGLAAMPEVAELAEQRAEDLREFATWTAGVTGGNALLVDRLLDAPDFIDHFRAGGPDRSLAPPARIAAVVASHVAELPDATKKVLGVAALFGPEIDTDLLQRVSDGPVVSALAAGRAARLLTGTGRRVRFVHDLVAVSLAAALPAKDRLAAHLRIADEIEQHLDGRGRVRRYELAYHLAQASPLAPPARVRAVATAAAELAAGQLEFGLAARCFETAAAHAEPSEVADILLRAAHAAVHDGDVDRARSLLARAEDAARRSGDPASSARVAIDACELVLRVDGYVTAPARALAAAARAGLDPRAHPALDTALAFELALAEQRPDALVGTVERQRSPADRVVFAERALELGHLEAQARLCEILVDAGTADGDVLGVIWSWVHAVQEGTAHLDDAARAKELARARQDSSVSAHAHWSAEVWHATRLIAMGRFAEGTAAAEHAVTTGRSEPEAAWRLRAVMSLWLHEGCIDFLTGRARTTNVPIDGTGRLWGQGPHFSRTWDAHRLAWGGELERARAELDRSCEALRDRAGQGGGWLMHLTLLGSAAYATSDQARAGDLLAQLEPHRGRRSLCPDGYIGAIDHSMALLHGVRGDLDRAVEGLRAAAVAHDIVGAEPFAVLSRTQLVLHLRRRGQTADLDEAAALVPEILSDADRLDMPRVRRMLAT